jgi:hypothetical protein
MVTPFGLQSGLKIKRGKKESRPFMAATKPGFFQCDFFRKIPEAKIAMKKLAHQLISRFSKCLSLPAFFFLF